MAMDTIFMKTPSVNGCTCGQVHIGLVSRMMTFHPLRSHNGGSTTASCQDFMCCEGVPSGLHRDASPEQKCTIITDVNGNMMVKEKLSELGHPNENPAEALGVNPLKRGVQALMDRTGALDIVWPWAHTCWCNINNICATPVLDWKTPILVHHGCTPDISAHLQCQFWEKIHFKVDESSPSTKESPGHWLGVSKTMGD